MEITKTIKVEDYGDMLAKIFDMELVTIQYYGLFDGDYLVVLNDKGIYKFYIDAFGSCSGCDWLEDKRNDAHEVNYLEALEYCQQVKLKFAIPQKLWKMLSDEQKLTLVDSEILGFSDNEELKEMGEELIKIK